GDDVAGEQPPAGEDGGRLLRPVPVPRHHLRPANVELAGLADADLAGAGLEVDHADLGRGEGQADGAEAALAVAGVAMGHRARLAQAVPLDQARAGGALEARVQVRVDRRGAGDADLDRGEVVAAGLRV